MKKRQTLALLLAAAFSPATLATDASTAYPTKSVRLVVGYPPGGAGDIFGRLVANYLSQNMGQQFVVENRPGAAGTIAAAQVARMPPDGYALYLASAGDFTTARSTFGERLAYSPERDFTHLTLLVKVPLVLVAHPSVPATTVQEFIAYAKTMPRQLNYASFGNGSTSHLSAEAFNLASGLEISHVAYKGSSPALTDLLAGRVQVMFDTVLSASRFTKTGQLKSFGVTTLKRVPLMSDTPTLDESGLAGFEMATWLGIVAPAGLPSPIMQALALKLDAFTKDPDIQKQLDALGLLVDGSGPAAFSTFIDEESARMDVLIKKAGIKFD
ncbi:MAG: tripartite tricarboxylate transporter substrate-binding protein [Alcaligenaceae bacterium]